MSAIISRPEAMLWLAVFLCCHAVRAWYEVSLTRGGAGFRGKAAYVFMVCVMIALWVSWFRLCETTPHAGAFPPAVRWAGCAVFAAGLALFFAGLVQLRGFEGRGRLVTTGLFRRLRHPMYLGFLLWLAGYPLFMNSLAALAVAPAGAAGVLVWRHFEEVRMAREFPEYTSYKKGTWF